MPATTGSSIDCPEEVTAAGAMLATLRELRGNDVKSRAALQRIPPMRHRTRIVD